MTGHTPGPWRAYEYEVVSKDDTRVAHTKTLTLAHDEERANARLIAAAPDLLEMVLALNGVLNDVMERLAELPETYQYGLYRAWATQQKALEAIAKAEGRES